MPQPEDLRLRNQSPQQRRTAHPSAPKHNFGSYCRLSASLWRLAALRRVPVRASPVRLHSPQFVGVPQSRAACAPSVPQPRFCQPETAGSVGADQDPPCGIDNDRSLGRHIPPHGPNFLFVDRSETIQHQLRAPAGPGHWPPRARSHSSLNSRQW